MNFEVKTFDELTKLELYRLLSLRVSVFVVEQSCPYQELDGLDIDALHLWLGEGGEILAYLRLIPGDGGRARLGRVIATVRRRGLGSELLRRAIEIARERLGAREIYLEAQVYAAGLYEKQGFERVSEEFLEDGIPHVGMLLTL